MAEKKKKRWGDRRDATMVREGNKGLQTIMAHLMPNRTDNEVYLQFNVDASRLMEYLNRRNSEGLDYKITIFHAAITAIARMVKERPLMNRFIQGRRLYERDEIQMSFVAKRRFADGADEALFVLSMKDDDTIDTVASKVYGDVKKERETEHATGGIDAIMDRLAKLPRPILMAIVKTVRILDFWGKNPKILTDGDPNYSTVLLSNLGSIKSPSVYHHLNNYGTLSILVTIGTLHKAEILMEDGHKEIRDVIDIGATLDERIGDGFYFAKSLKLVEHIFAHPELLERPLAENSGFEY